MNVYSLITTKSKKIVRLLNSIVWLTITMLPGVSLADSGTLPAGNPITFDFINTLAGDLLNFLIALSATVMVASIVISGIMITTSGADKSRYEKGLKALKAAIWGAGIVLAAAVIINTLYAIVDRSFFCNVSVVGVCILN